VSPIWAYCGFPFRCRFPFREFGDVASNGMYRIKLTELLGGMAAPAVVFAIPIPESANMTHGPASRLSHGYLRVSVRGLIVVVLAIGGGLGWMVRSARIHVELLKSRQRRGAAG
jgi:hypothetical protein